MTKRLLVAVALMAGCSTDSETSKDLVPCDDGQCEPICASSDRTVLPMGTVCTGTNDVGVVNNQGALVTEFECELIVIEVDGHTGCCLLGSEGVARFFDCEGQ